MRDLYTLYSELNSKFLKELNKVYLENSGTYIDINYIGVDFSLIDSDDENIRDNSDFVIKGRYGRYTDDKEKDYLNFDKEFEIKCLVDDSVDYITGRFAQIVYEAD